MPPKSKSPKQVETLNHKKDTRKNIPTAEYQSVMAEDEQKPVRVAYERRNRDLDPQLVWRGKDEQDWSDLVVNAPPLYIQEKVHPKVIIDDLVNSDQWLVRGVNSGECLVNSKDSGLTTNHKPLATPKAAQLELDLFADFNGIPDGADATDFYQHDAHWTNRMILGDSLQVMASLAEREGLRGKVQCIYIDPPYGIKFNSNFQWSTTSRDVKDGKTDHITREPEQVKAFRDTWRDGIHSYLTYLRDRLTVARDLLSDSGSIFIQIGDENVHRVRALVDEVFGEDNFIGLIWFRKKTMPLGDKYLERMGDYIIWCSKDASQAKFRRLFKQINISGDFHWNWRQINGLERRKFSKKELEKNPAGEPIRLVSMWPPSFSEKDVYNLPFQGKNYPPANGQCYPSSLEKLERAQKAGRLELEGKYLRYVMKLSDDDTTKLNLTWTDTIGAGGQRYVVETNPSVVERCILMTTDPGDLVLDPTCLRKGTKIVTEHGLKPVEKIEVGEQVLTHTGQFKPVLKSMKRDYRGKMVGIKRRGHYQTLWVTADHPVLAVRTKDCFDGRVCHSIPECRFHKRGLYLTCSNPKQEYKEEWIPAGELKADDYVICDAPIDAIDKPLTPELAYLLGLYLAEGFCDQYSLCFCFHEDEDHLINAVQTLLPKLFGCQPGKRFNEKETGKAYKIRFHSRTAVEFFRQFGHRATEKFLSDWVLQCNQEAQAEIIRGWFEGDGNIYRDGFRAGSVSPSLADGMSRLLWRQGIVATVGKTDAHTRPNAFASKHDVVTVSVHGRYIPQMTQIMQVEFEYEGKRQTDRVGWVHDNQRLWAKIESIQHERKHEVVYNLTVEDDHSFVTEVCTVHNCGSGTTAYVAEQ